VGHILIHVHTRSLPFEYQLIIIYKKLKEFYTFQLNIFTI